MNVVSFGLAQPAQALAIIGKTLAQAIAEELLQMREAVIAEALGEAHQGRGLHARMLGDARHRAERHLLGMREGEGRELLQPFRHGLAPAQQQSPKAFVIVRDGIDRHFRAVPHGAGLPFALFSARSTDLDTDRPKME